MKQSDFAGVLRAFRTAVFGTVFLVLCTDLAPVANSIEIPDADDRVRWTNSRLAGSPEPPPAYTVEKTFTKIEWKLPLYLAPEPGTDKLWVVLQGGDKLGPSRIVRIQNQPDTDQTETILELDDRLIYGLTFHPNYETTGFVYLFSNGPTSAKERKNRILRFSVSRQVPFTLDASSEKVIIEWRSMGHDGGDLAFGRDGMLYIPAGDGTSDSDTWNSGQDVTGLLATLIRIDVDHPADGMSYSVPADNPFVNLPGARPEIWAYGFRNPWRISLDAKTGDLWVGNNGQDLWETAYLVRRGDNFGWSVYEGNHPFYPNRKRGPTPIVPPTIEHHHSIFRSLTGGVVYYGDKLPDLNGAYIYGDYSTGKIWGARHRDDRLVWNEELADTALQIAAFRVDQHGELLVVDIGGGIYRLVPRPKEPEISDRRSTKFPTRLSDTGLFASPGDHRVDPGLIPYSINAPGWADGATAERFIALPGDSKIKYRQSRGWDFPDGSALVQTISLETEIGNSNALRRIETRVLLKQQGEWAGYSYRWNDEQTDAVLVAKDGADIELVIRDGSAAGGVRRHAWRIPSRTECMACHSRAANFVLGPSELQMNRDHDYGSQRENQLAALHRLGVLTDWPPAPPKEADKPKYTPGKLVNPYDASEDLDKRARSYLHTNCSVCHVEAGGGNAKMQLEFTQPPGEMSLFSARPQHDTFGLTNAMLMAPADPDRSILLHRVSRRGRGQMPPLVTSQVDQRAVELLREWIRQMKPDSVFVRAWTMDDLAGDLDQLDWGRSFASGKSVLEKVGCAQCHRFAGEGGTVGTDLTGISRRLSKREILESILEPSKVVADEYASFIFATESGKLVTGRIERETDQQLVIRTGQGSDDVVRLAKSDIAERRKSAASNMPAEIINVLEKNQILDLLAYLLSEGNGDAFSTHDPNLYLLVDDHWIAQQSGLKRVINRARPLPEPIVWPDDPKTETDFAWGNVIREPDSRFRLWYGTMMMGPNAAGAHEMAKAGVWGRGDDFNFHPRSRDDVREVDTMLGKYAESTDGIRWTKPTLNLIEFRGSRDNNIILNGEHAARQSHGLLTNFDGYSILRDDNEPDPDRRYKMIAHWESVHCWDNHEVSGSLGRAKDKRDAYWSARGEYITFSPDGLRWEQPLERVNLPSGGGDRLLVVPDHRHRRWMAYVRAGGWAYPALSYSRDLRDWSPAEPAKHITPASVQAPAVECMIPFNYGNQDLALPCGMDKPRGVFTPMLASRHDGGEWTWVDNTEPFIPFGPPSSYYASGCVPLHNEPIVVGDEMLIYFNAFSRNQSPPCRFGTRSIGLAKLRRDAFAGLTAADRAKPGTLVTQPITVAGNVLEINVEQRGRIGSVTVAILDENQQEIPSFGFVDAQPITGDAVRARVTWKDDRDLRPLMGKQVRLALHIEGDAVLYAWSFRNESR